MVMFDLSPEPVARQAARRSVELFEAAGDRVRAAESKCLVALDGWFGADPREPRRLLHEARETCTARDDRWGEAFAAFVEMLVVCKHGDLAEAVAHGQRSIDMFDEVGDPWALTAVPAHMGEILRWKGDLEGAIAAQTRALAGAERAALPHVVMFCLHELGQLSALTGDAAAAREWFERGLEAAEELGHGFWFAAFGQSMADAVREQDAARAESLYARAETEARRLGMSAARALAGRAEALTLAGEADAARRLFAEGVDEAARLGDPPGLLRCLAGLIRLAGRSGDDRGVALLVGRIDAVTAASGIVAPAGDELDAYREGARTRLGPNRFDELAAHGARADPADLAVSMAP